MLKAYLGEIFKVGQKGDATEQSYYKVLASLLEAFARSINRPRTEVTISPKKTDAGNPDFRVWDGKQHIVGYIEAKPPEQENLEKIEESEQLRRYRSAFANVILTNFFEFRLYRDGLLVDKVAIGRPFIARQLKVVPPAENQDKFLDLLNKFFTFSLPRQYTPEALAKALALRTHYLCEQVLLELGRSNGNLMGFYKAFQQHLIAGLTEEDFADMYAQTITYGLFAASTRCKGEFNKRLAFDNIPRTIGILRDVFRFVSLGEPGPELDWIVEDIADTLAVADVKNVLHKYFVERRGSDPIMHFYETFLAQYNPKEREQRGVYYTPQEVVSYIVRSLNIILREYFGKPDGFATGSVTVLDPAAGTLTFLAQAASVAANDFSARYGTGGVSELISKHILKNFYAFELMMAPYAIAHLKIGFLLEELGYRLGEHERFKLYLTNTLELEDLAQSDLPGMSSLSEESHAAGAIKKETPILVILGNPPYSGHSANRSWKLDEKGKKIPNFIGKLIRDYYQVDGKPLAEKNPKWLQDDYVKFIRFAQWKIDQAGEGALGFITNHSYLDNPTFRGMRQSLMNTFNQIYILDLHGNKKKKEKCPDGSEDKNVFEIQQGVAILLAVKKPGLKRKVSHADCWGLREVKYEWLKANDVESTKWKKLVPKSEFYFFVPRDETLLGAYEKLPKVTDLFPVSSVGVVTARDNLTIAWTRQDMLNTVSHFSQMEREVARLAYGLGKDVRDWKIELAQKDLRESGLDENRVVRILYRPFDNRFTYYTGRSRGFHCMPRPEVMRHMLHHNLGLCVGRAGQVVGLEKPWNVVFCADCIQDFNLFYRGGNVNFPLYLYPEEDLYNNGPEYNRQVNIAREVWSALENAYGVRPKPEAILHYIYAVLYSNVYRQRYAEFLKSDFPRIPFCADYKVFGKVAGLGEKLVALHLMNWDRLAKPVAKFEGKGDNLVAEVVYNQGKKAAYVNPAQYFGPIGKDIWDYQIGGYQVMAKWLKDRKGRRLSLDDIKHYCRITAALKETIAAQKRIDAIYKDIEKNSVRIG